MGLSLKVTDLTNKKADSRASLVIIAAGFFWCGQGSFAQELSKKVVLAGQNLTVMLDPLDSGCKVAEPISAKKTFCFGVRVKGANGAWQKDLSITKFDATMPGHHHGMITRPKVIAIKPGEYLIEGVKLHMRGDWSLELKLQHGRETAQVAIPLKL